MSSSVLVWATGFRFVDLYQRRERKQLRFNA
jgi:hypothetical protein